jgi:hypothetical protein
MTESLLSRMRGNLAGMAWPPVLSGPLASLAVLAREMERSQWLPQAEIAARQHRQLVAVATMLRPSRPILLRAWHRPASSQPILARPKDSAASPCSGGATSSRPGQPSSAGRFWPRLNPIRYRDLAAVAEYQIVQSEPDLLEMKLVVERPLTAKQEADLADLLRDAVGYPFRIAFTYYEGEIPRGPGRKFEEFLCLLPEEGGSQSR